MTEPDPNMPIRLVLRPGDAVREHLAARGPVAGSLMRRELDRYAEVLRRALATVELSEAEASLVCDALNGTMFETHTVPLLWAEIDDAIRLDGLDQKWGVDGPALVEKLRGLSYAQALAIVDAVERAWYRVGHGDGELDLRAVGLVRGAAQ